MLVLYKTFQVLFRMVLHLLSDHIISVFLFLSLLKVTFSEFSLHIVFLLYDIILIRTRIYGNNCLSFFFFFMEFVEFISIQATALKEESDFLEQTENPIMDFSLNYILSILAYST